jgi:hypothetical protein
MPPDDIEQIRKMVPIPYVQLVPVHVDSFGRIQEIATLLRVLDDDTFSRTLVGGRILYLESIREAIARNIAKDLGQMALPRLPLSIQPFMVAEFFPAQGFSQMYDPRQHAIALCYVIPVSGDCSPQDRALDLTWLKPEQVDQRILSEMAEGHGQILVQALRWSGVGEQ